MQSSDQFRDIADEFDEKTKANVDKFVNNPKKGYDKGHAWARYAVHNDNFIENRAYMYPIKHSRRPRNLKKKKFSMNIYFDYDEVKNAVNKHIEDKNTENDLKDITYTKSVSNFFSYIKQSYETLFSLIHKKIQKYFD